MKVIVVSGKAQHGKDTTAKLLQKELTVCAGKRVIIAHYADLVKYVCSKYFNWNGEKDEAGRTLLQYVGTDVVRAQEPNYWVDFVISIMRLFKNEWDYVIIPDCRFPNEIDRLKEAGFEVKHVRVVRDNFDNGLTEAQKNHPSETSLDNYKPDYLLKNNGTENDLHEHIIFMIADMYGYHDYMIMEDSE